MNPEGFSFGHSGKWHHLTAGSYNNLYNGSNHIVKGKEWVRVALDRRLPYLSDQPYTIQDSDQGNPMKKKGKSTIKHGSAEKAKKPAARRTRGG